MMQLSRLRPPVLPSSVGQSTSSVSVSGSLNTLDAGNWSLPSRSCTNCMSMHAAPGLRRGMLGRGGGKLDQAVGGRDLAVLQLQALRFHHPEQLLDNPAILVPPNHLPGLRRIGDLMRGHQPPMQWLDIRRRTDLAHVEQPQPHGFSQRTVLFIARTTDLHRAVSQFNDSDSFGTVWLASRQIDLPLPRHGIFPRRSEQRAAINQPAVDPSPSQGHAWPGSADARRSAAKRHTWGRYPPRDQTSRLSSRLAAAPPAPALPLPANDATPDPRMGDPDGARSPRPVGSRPHRPPIQGRRWWWRPPRSSRAPAHHKYSHASPGRGHADAAPSSGTSPRSCHRSPAHAARRTRHRSDPTRRRRSSVRSPSCWQRTARLALRLHGCRPAGANTPSCAQPSVRESRPPFIEAQIAECPQRHLHGGSCRSAAAGQGIVLTSRRANEKCSGGPDVP
jgi:hypothetical protein